MDHLSLLFKHLTKESVTPSFVTSVCKKGYQIFLSKPREVVFSQFASGKDQDAEK